MTQVVVVPACDSCGVPAYGAPVYGYPTQEGSYESGTPITPAPTPTTTRRYNLLNGVRPGMLFPVVGYRAPQSYVSRTDSEAVYPTASRERVQTVRPVSASRTTLIMPRR
ncbi:MAG: hypothetical protein ACKV0T_24235 [Planctomycetales bacterium]